MIDILVLNETFVALQSFQVLIFKAIPTSFGVLIFKGHTDVLPSFGLLPTRFLGSYRRPSECFLEWENVGHYFWVKCRAFFWG